VCCVVYHIENNTIHARVGTVADYCKSVWKQNGQLDLGYDGCVGVVWVGLRPHAISSGELDHLEPGEISVILVDEGATKSNVERKYSSNRPTAI